MKPTIIFFFAIILSACHSTKKAGDCIDESKIVAEAPCIQIYKPVCGCNNETYANDCLATNAGVTSWKEGACPGD